MPDKTTEGMLSVVEVAEKLGVHRSTIDNYIHRGILVPDKVLADFANGRSGNRYFNSSTVSEFMEKCGFREGDTEPILTSGDVCEMLGLTHSGLNYHIYKGVLKPDIVLPQLRGNRYGERRFRRSTIEAFVASTRFKAKAVK